MAASPGDAGADDEDLRRRDLARRGDLAGEEAAELVGRLDDRAVPGDVGHRAEHVERLRPGDARHGVHGEDGDPPGRQLGDEVGVDGRADQAGQDRAVTQAGDLLVGRGVDLQDEVAGPHLVLGGDPRAGLLVGGVGEAGPGAGPGLDDHLVAQAPQLLDGLRGGRDARLPRPGLGRDTDLLCGRHRHSALGSNWVAARVSNAAPTLRARTCWRPARQGTHRGPSADQGLDVS